MIYIKEVPYKMAGRMFHINDSVITVGGKDGTATVTFGDGQVPLIAGPCAIESHSQLLDIAQKIKNAGADVLRGGAFKPRTSPYSFQGLGAEGLQYLSEAKALTGLPTVSEIMDASQIPLFEDVDILQVGAKNMQNFSLLKALGQVKKPVLLKRGFGCTIEEFLLSAEYILAYGNPNVILCERGEKTFEPMTKFSMDMGVFSLIREQSHLPVIADPSHGSSNASLVRPLTKAALVAGAQGIMVEVHDDPENALCDGKQAISSNELGDIAKDIQVLAPYAHHPKNPFLGNLNDIKLHTSKE